MPRSKMPDAMRDKIVALVQGGANWSKIQRETGIDRRTAKSVYDKWKRSSSIEELQKVRQEIAAVEFRTHMDSMVTLALTLVSNLTLPSSILGMKNNSQEFFDWFWQQDLLMRYPNSPQDTIIPIENEGFRTIDPKIYYDEKKLLFKSLIDHTRGEVQWSVLDNDWKNARDKCAAIVPVFFTETQSLINDYIENANDPGFLKSLKKITKKDDPVQIVTNTITNVMWRSFTSGGPYKGGSPSFEMTKRDKSENVNVITIRSGDEILFSLVGEDKEYLANKVTVTCNAVIRVLAEQKTMPELRREVGNLKKASDDLRVMLNPLKLRPLILRTRCEICPV